MLKKTEIVHMYRICYETVCAWIKRYNEKGSYESRQGMNCGRDARFNDRQSILRLTLMQMVLGYATL